MMIKKRSTLRGGVSTTTSRLIVLTLTSMFLSSTLVGTVESIRVPLLRSGRNDDQAVDGSNQASTISESLDDENGRELANVFVRPGKGKAKEEAKVEERAKVEVKAKVEERAKVEVKAKVEERAKVE
eukprot:CAMPEP_0178476152 /NCGR_PEP_ID=MMETSP0696-20121128/3481_1 /TAXON_ID=265572 /ORGANISM="Extubocellulus spinifer, Strain CCMP396" /LENGTH=126 /DNA_ID=CAMNT_0020103449 /DNA_START=255 /DNA_END=633 /DNA_ORIENTATION=+